MVAVYPLYFLFSFSPSSSLDVLLDFAVLDVVVVTADNDLRNLDGGAVEGAAGGLNSGHVGLIFLVLLK